jgi:hypothetical protein
MQRQSLSFIAVLTTLLAAVLTTLAALSTLLPALAGLVLTTLLLLTGLLLSAAALLRVALVLLLVALRIVLAWIVRHWDVLQSFRGFSREDPLPAPWFNARQSVLFPWRRNKVQTKD